MERQLFCLWTGRLNITKIPILPKEIYRFNTLSVKILVAFFFFAEIENFTLTVTRVTSNSQTILEKNTAKDSLPHFKTHHKAATIETVRCCHKIKRTNGIETRAQT